MVVGCYQDQDWVLPAPWPTAAGAPTPDAPMPGVAAPGMVYQNYGQTDVISSETAHRHIMDIYYMARTTYGDNAKSVSVDLLAGASMLGGFQWHRFLMGRPWGMAIYQEQVTSLRLVCAKIGPAIAVTTAAQPHTSYITWHGSQARLTPS